jgi:hypothetical protein
MRMGNGMWLWAGCALGMLLAVGCGGEVDDPRGKRDGIRVAASGGTGGGGSAGSGGSSSSAGRSGGAGAVGGGNGKGGSDGVGGVGGAGHGGGGGLECDPGGASNGTPGDCVPLDPGNACQECIEASCCTEWSRCIATSPDNVCAWGGPNGEGEIVCFQNCVLSAVADGGVADDDTLVLCAAGCATPQCTTIGATTNYLIGCLTTNCIAACFMP